MHQPTLTLTLTRLGAAVLALARRPGGGAPPWRWRAVLAVAPPWRYALARRRVGGYAPSWRLSPPWRERAVPAAARRLGGSRAPSRLRRAVPAAVRRPDASTALARARCPGACVPLWRERAVLARARRPGGCAPSWWICAVPSGRLRRLGACAPSRLLCVGLALARNPGGCALSRGEGHAPHESAGYHPPTVRAPLRMHPVVSMCVYVVPCV